MIKSLPIGSSPKESFGAEQKPGSDPRKVNLLNADCQNAKQIFTTLLQGTGQTFPEFHGRLTGFEFMIADPESRQWVTKKRYNCANRRSFEETNEFVIAASNGLFRIWLARTSPVCLSSFVVALVTLLLFLVFIFLAVYPPKHLK